jgi:capsular polysaccharide biosynthesis protein
LLDVTVQAGNAQEAERLGFAMAEVLQNRGALYMRQLASSSGHVAILDQPKPRPSTTTGSLVADLTLRGALGLVAGLFLAFAADYFDTTLRSRREVERLLDLPILAEVPALAR